MGPLDRHPSARTDPDFSPDPGRLRVPVPEALSYLRLLLLAGWGQGGICWAGGPRPSELRRGSAAAEGCGTDFSRRHGTTGDRPCSAIGRVFERSAVRLNAPAARERAVADTDRGFGVVDPEIVFAKLETLAEGAAIARSEMFRPAALVGSEFTPSI